MCGISGYLWQEIISKPLIKTLNLMKNRGPDNQNFKFLKHNSKIFLLSSRLKIVDRLDRSINQWKLMIVLFLLMVKFTT